MINFEGGANEIQHIQFVFAYNTTMSSSTVVTPHYAMFGKEAMLPVDWVFLPFQQRRDLCFSGRETC